MNDPFEHHDVGHLSASSINEYIQTQHVGCCMSQDLETAQAFRRCGAELL